MRDEASLAKDDELTVAGKQGAPFSFTAVIGQASAGEGATRSFEITGEDPRTHQPKTRRYHLPNVEHKSYLDLFQNLAGDFGLRLPRNRQPAPAPDFSADYQVLLTENLAPGMLYGYGDPAVLRLEESAERAPGVWYYFVVTSNDAPDSFPIIRSRNLTDWELTGFVFPKGDKPAWAADGALVSDYWAPEMRRVGGEFRVYFAGREQKTRAISIGIARSPRPEGPFVAADEPLLRGGVIDPHLFVEDDGTAFLFWKKDNNDIWPSLLNQLLYKHPHLITELFPDREDQLTASLMQALWPWAETLEPMERFFVQQPLIEAVTSAFSAFCERLAARLEKDDKAKVSEDVRGVLKVMRTPVYAQQLSPDGASFVGEPKKVIENDQAWEAHLVEGMWVTKQRGKYYLFYSGNDFSTAEYGIGVAVADSLFGPYRKKAEPLLRSTADWAGPGHPSVSVGPDGAPWLFLHAFFPGRTGYKEFRALLGMPVEFAGEQVLLRQSKLAR